MRLRVGIGLLAACVASSACASSSSGSSGAADGGAAESPIANRTLVAFSQPAEGATAVDVFAVPVATAADGFDRAFSLGSDDFKITIDSFTLETSDTHVQVEGLGWVDPQDATRAGFYTRNDPLPSTTRLTATIVVHADEYDAKNDKWFTATLRDGTPVTQTATVHFTSGVRP